MVLGTAITHAQKVEICNGDKSQRMDLMSKSVVFNQVGINLNKYNWDNPNINCHINETILNLKDRGNYYYLGWSGVGVGAGLILGGVSYLANPYTDGAGGGFVALGALATGGGIYLLTLAAKKKKKHDYHLNQVNQYYRSQGLF